MSALTFERLRAASLPRSVRYYAPLQDPWSIEDLLVALGGEVGEALNVMKKLERDRKGMRGNSEGFASLVRSLGKELSDATIYLDLTMAAGKLAPFGAAEFSFGSMQAPRPTINLNRIGASMFVEAGRFADLIQRAEIEAEMGDSDHTEQYRTRAREGALQLMNRIGMAATVLGMDLGDEVAAKFNATSEKLNFPERL